MEMIERDGVEAVMPVVEFSYKFKYPQYARSRSQDLEKQYHDAGQFYVYNVENYLRNNGKIMDNIIPIIVPELEVQDIDNEVDWKLAEMKYQLMKNDF